MVARTVATAVALAVVAGLAPTVFAGGPVYQESMSAARRALNDLDYRSARTALAKALRSGQAEPDELAAIYRQLGEVAAALGDEEQAVKFFSRLLAIDPEAQLADGVSPRISVPFARARRSRPTESPFSIRCDAADGDPPVYRVNMEADDLHLVAQVAVEYRGEANRLSLRGERVNSAAVEIALPSNSSAIRLALLDAHGNRLRWWPVSTCAKSEARAPLLGPDEPAKPRRSILTHWGLWGGAAVAFAAAGTWATLSARSNQRQLDQIVANSGEHEFEEALAIEDRVRSRWRVAGVGWGLATAAATTAVVFYVRARGPASERRPGRAVVAPLVGPDTLGAMAEVRF